MKKLVITIIIFFVTIIFVALFRTMHLNPLPENVKADKIEVYKSKRKLLLISDGEVIKTYRITLGNNPKGHKQFQGDEKTPEGNYIIDWRNPESVAYLSLHISYPNAQDKSYANEQGKSPGGDIMIHGIPNGFGRIGNYHLFLMKTDGCIQVTNKEMDELWRAIDNGTPIEIFP